MHTSKTFLLFYLANLITANATTDVARRAQQQAVAECEDLPSSTATSDGTTTTISLFPDPSCWNTLDMTDWMKKWNGTIFLCPATQKLVAPCQCHIDQPWATCFMQLTYARNKTAGYLCTDLAKPENCTMPTPRNVVPGPAEIFYGAYSIWSSFNLLAVWFKTLTSPTAIPAITNELSKAKISASSVNQLLVALVEDYAVDEITSQALISILTTKPFSADESAQEVPTLSNAQALLGQLLQRLLDYVMSDWADGSFLSLAEGGNLLNGTVETTKFLTARLEEG